MYAADSTQHVIRRWDAATGKLARNTQQQKPQQEQQLCALSSQQVCFQSHQQHLPCRRPTTGAWELLAGLSDTPGFANGPASRALFCRPRGLCLMPYGVLAVIDAGNACIRGIELAPPGGGEPYVSTLAGGCGGKPGFADGPAADALFSDGMQSLACLPNCSLLVGDLGSGRLR